MRPTNLLSEYGSESVTKIWLRAGLHGCHVQNDKVCSSLVLRMRKNKFRSQGGCRVHDAAWRPAVDQRGAVYFEIMYAPLAAQIFYGWLLHRRNRRHWRALSFLKQLPTFVIFTGCSQAATGEEEWKRSQFPGAARAVGSLKVQCERVHLKNLSSLKNLSLYKEKSNVQKYVDNVWLSCLFPLGKIHEKRETQHRPTNNRTEAQNKTLQVWVLTISLDKSVYRISVVLVDRYIPDFHQKYLERNVQLSSAYRRYNPTIPSY